MFWSTLILLKLLTKLYGPCKVDIRLLKSPVYLVRSSRGKIFLNPIDWWGICCFSCNANLADRVCYKYIWRFCSILKSHELRRKHDLLIHVIIHVYNLLRQLRMGTNKLSCSHCRCWVFSIKIRRRMSWIWICLTLSNSRFIAMKLLAFFQNLMNWVYKIVAELV